ncbi:MAG: YjbF family lipoprotein [Rhodobacter sp.]|nr:YjbF family lipoprotein [Rhodobacter sp.]
MSGRLRLVSLVALLTLGACGSDLSGKALQRIAGAPPGVDPPEMQRLTAADAPILIVRLLDRGQASSLRKAGQRDGVISWRALDNVRLYTRDGMIVATRGLSFDLMTSDTGDAASLIASGRDGQVVRVLRLMDGEDRLEIRSYFCDIIPVGPEQIRTGERERTMTLRVDETCSNPRGDISNRYWVLGGRILQAEQTFSPEIGRVQILLLP